jgi:Na+/proline symporter
LAAVVYFAGAGRKINPDHIFGLVAAEFLPKVSYGVLGLFLASLLTSAVGSCDSFMVASAGLFTENIYKRQLPNKSQKHYIFIARMTSFLVVAGGVTFAYWLPSVVKGLEIFWVISSMMGIAFWMGLFWRRATAAGAWAATLTAFAVWWLTTQQFIIQWLSGLPIAESLRFIFVRNGTPEVYLPWQMIFYLSAGLIVGIIASLATRPVVKEKLDNFYALVRTPIRQGEKVLAPCTLPQGVVAPPKRSVFPNTNFEVLVPARVTVIGFLVACGCVFSIIYGFYLIVKA